MIVLVMLIILKVLSKVGTLVEIIKEKRLVFVKVSGAGFFPPERGFWSGVSPARAGQGETKSQPYLPYSPSYNYGP